MKTKDDIVANWLPRYTGTRLEEFGQYILLVNFSNYVRTFAEWHKVPVRGEDRPMLNATAQGITGLLDGLEREAMVLRAAPESAATAARFAEATAAMELLRLDLMKLAAGRTGPSELTAAIERVRDVGRRVDAIVGVGESGVAPRRPK